MRLAEPVCQNSIFRHPHHHARRADDGGVDGSGKNQKSDHHDEDAEDDPQRHRSNHVHRHAGDQIVGVDLDPDAVRNNHRRQHGPDAGEDEAVDRNNNGRAFQVLQLRVLDLPIDLGQRFLAAHGQNGMSESHQNSEDPQHVGQLRAAQESQCVVGEMQIRRNRQRRQLGMDVEGGEEAPAQQQNHHHGSHLHHGQRLVRRLLNALQVLPPVVDGDHRGQNRRHFVHRQPVVGQPSHPRRYPSTSRAHAQHLVQ